MTVAVNAVLLDLDGTLLDHVGAASAAFLTVCADWLPTLNEQDRKAALTVWQALETEHMQRFLEGAATFQGQRRARVRGVLEAHGRDTCDLSDADVDVTFSRYLKEYEAAWTPFDDVAAVMPFLWEAPGGVAILSNGDRRQQEAKVAAIGMHPSPRLFVPADVGAPKPEPASFRGACAAMGWEPAKVLYIGDDLATDARAAVRAGLLGCWLDRRPAGRSDEEADTLRISSLLQLPERIVWR
jgi:putative hydrolase of the HAD superfamily